MSAYSVEELKVKSEAWLLTKRGLGPDLSESTQQRIEDELIRRGVANIPPIPKKAVKKSKSNLKIRLLLAIFFVVSWLVSQITHPLMARSPGWFLILLVVYGLIYLLMRSFEQQNDRERALTKGARDGVTELMLVAAEGDIERAKELLNYGTPIDDATKSGLTALMYAAANGQTEMCSLLLMRGASPTLLSAKGKNAAEFAREKGHFEVGVLLQNQKCQA